MPNHRVIIDCDPGHDDFAAIALAAAAPEIAIETVIAVNGNAPLHHTATNALAIAAALDLDCPVYAGAEQALHHRYEYPTAFHGKTGLDSKGAGLPSHERKLADGHGALEIIHRVRAAPGELTLVVLGPMTNVALALALDPGIAPLVRKLVFMGGGIIGGNVTAQAEFNLWADPDAAAIVLNSEMRVIMFGLDVTNRAFLSMAELDSLYQTVAGVNPVADILQFYAKSVGNMGPGGLPGPTLHDPCPIAWLIQPDLFAIESLSVTVGLVPGSHYGSTTADRRAWRDPDLPQIGVATSIDREGFVRLLLPALQAAARSVAAKSAALAQTH